MPGFYAAQRSQCRQAAAFRMPRARRKPLQLPSPLMDCSEEAQSTALSAQRCRPLRFEPRAYAAADYSCLRASRPLDGRPHRRAAARLPCREARDRRARASERACPDTPGVPCAAKFTRARQRRATRLRLPTASRAAMVFFFFFFFFPTRWRCAPPA